MFKISHIHVCNANWISNCLSSLWKVRHLCNFFYCAFIHLLYSYGMCRVNVDHLLLTLPGFEYFAKPLYCYPYLVWIFWEAYVHLPSWYMFWDLLFIHIGVIYEIWYPRPTLDKSNNPKKFGVACQHYKY